MNIRKLSYLVVFVGILLIVFGFVFFSNSSFSSTAEKEKDKTNEEEINDSTGEPPIRDGDKEAEKGKKDEEEVDEISYEAVEVSSNNINLSEYSSNIVIRAGGEYSLTGSFNYSIYIDSDLSVTLNLKNVNIKSTSDAAIANIRSNSLIVNINEGSNNVISDGKNKSSLDGCLFSNGPLKVNGKGILKVYGNQIDGEGIATKNNPITISESNIFIYSVDDGINTGGDGGTITINSGNLYIEAGGDAIDSNKNIIINGGKINVYGGLNGANSFIDVDDNYIINGGTIVGAGTDHLIVPNSSSKSKVIAFEFIDSIPADSLIVLLNEKNDIVFSLKVKSAMNSLIYSSNELKNGKYYLYLGGNIKNNKYTKGVALNINNINEFIVNKNINTFVEK